MKRLLIPAAALALALPAFAATPTAPSRTPCDAVVRLGVLPVWARAGFSGERPRIPHEIGRSGRIAAVLFGYPLLSPPSKTRNNKILWVAKTGSRTPTALWIQAQLMEGDQQVGTLVGRIVAGGPGPSIVDLPATGCWRLRLSWSGRTDTLDLEYRAG